MRRVAWLGLLFVPACAQSTTDPKPKDLSAIAIVDLASSDLGPPASSDLACQHLAATFAMAPLGWSLLGGTVSDTGNARLQLTAAYNDKSGTAFSVTPLPISAFEASFKYYIGDGSGGEGLAFVLARAPNLAALAPKGTGNTIGYVGMDGFAIELDTTPGGVGDPDGNHVAFTRANTGAHLASAMPPFALHCGCERQARIRYVNNHLTVTLDTTVVLDAQVSGFVPDTYYVGFAASTGGSDDVHAVRDFKFALGAVGSGCTP